MSMPKLNAPCRNPLAPVEYEHTGSYSNQICRNAKRLSKFEYSCRNELPPCRVQLRRCRFAMRKGVVVSRRYRRLVGKQETSTSIRHTRRHWSQLSRTGRIPNSFTKNVTPEHQSALRAPIQTPVTSDGGIVVSIAAFQAVDPGSIPGHRRRRF